MASTQIRSVAVAGASGNIGRPLVKQLHAAGFTVTALTRHDSHSSFPGFVKVIPVDYSSVSDLTQALHGQDAAVSVVGALSLPVQPALIEAAAKAGVKRFIPAEFGADTLHPKVRGFPVLHDKLAAQKQLAELAKMTDLTYTLIFTGLFLDSGLEGMILDVKGRKGTFYDGGLTEVSMTTLPTIAKAIVACLQRADETENRGVYVHSGPISQKLLLDLAKKIDPQSEWQLHHADTAELEKASWAAYERKETNPWALSGSVFRMYFGGQEYGQPFQKVDNELLGIDEISLSELEDLIRSIMVPGT